MSFLNGLYETTDIQLNGENSVSNNTTGGAEFYLISTLGEDFVIYVDGTSVFVLNSSTGVLTISTPINITSTFSVNGNPTVQSFLSGALNSNLNTGTQPFPSLNPSSQGNTAYGVDALQLVTSGQANTALGRGALKLCQTGVSNIGVGTFALQYLTSGSLNLAFGYGAGEKFITSLVATCLGYFAGGNGFQADYSNLIGNLSYVASAGLSYSTCLGTGSFIDANNQVALGTSADTVVVRGNTDLTAGTAITTTQALTDNSTKIATTAFLKKFIYYDAIKGLAVNTTQFPNAVFGAANNLAFGENALKRITTGYSNTAIGAAALEYLTTGTGNFALGTGALGSSISGPAVSNNIAIGQLALTNCNGNSNIAIGGGVGANCNSSDNVFIGNGSGSGNITGNGRNTGMGADSFQLLTTGENNTAVGSIAGAGLTTGSNCSFIGFAASASPGTISYATAIGAGSIATTSNSIYLGRGTDITYCVGGCNIPSGKTLTIVGGLTFNGTAVSGSIVDTGTVSQAITARKDFNGFDNTAPNYCGSSFVSPVMRPRLFSLNDSIQNSCHAFGSNAARNLQVDPTNSAVYCLGQDNLSFKTLNCFNVCSIGGANMTNFTTENFSGVTIIGQGNLEVETGYSMNNVTIMGGTHTFKNGAIVPTSVTNAVFNNAYGIQLASASAISNVFAIRTAQPITKSNQGIIGDSTEITLHSTGQKVIVTGSLEIDTSLISSIFSPTLNWSSANFNLSATTKFLMYYHFILNAATTVTLPVVTAAMVGQEFTFKRRGGALFILSLQTSGTPVQPVFPIGSSLGTIAFPYALISATQSVAKLMCIQSHFAGSGTATTTLGSNSLTVVTWNTLPLAMITVGTVITLGAVVKRVTAFGTGRGGTGSYTMDSVYTAATITPQPITSTDMFGYDILYVQ